jgi:hypothetical protein
MTFDPDRALEAPLTAIPWTLIGIYPIGHIYYFEFPTEPGSDEYTAGGAAIVKRMGFAIGQYPQQWVYAPTVEIRWGEISDATREPILVT